MVSTNYTIGTLTVFKDNAIEALILSLSPDQLLKIIYDLCENYSEQLYVESAAETRLCFNGKVFDVVDPSTTWRPLNDAECLLLLKGAVAAYKETIHLTALKDAIDCCGEKAKKSMRFNDLSYEVGQLIKAESNKKRLQSLQATLQGFAQTLEQVEDKSHLRFDAILSDVVLARLLTQAEKYDNQRYDFFATHLQQSISEIAYRWGKDGLDGDGDYKWKPLSVLDIQSIAMRAFLLCGNANTATLFSRSISYIQSTLRSYEEKGYHSKHKVDKTLGSIIEHLDLQAELFGLQEAEKKEMATVKTPVKADFPKIVQENLSAFITSIGGELSLASMGKLMKKYKLPAITELALRDLQKLFHRWSLEYHPDKLKKTDTTSTKWQEVYTLYQQLKECWLKHGATSYAL